MRSLYGLKRLSILDLSRNQLTVINRRMFAGFSSLGTLNLAKNRIGTIEGGALYLRSLRMLYLDENMKEMITMIDTHQHLS